MNSYANAAQSNNIKKNSHCNSKQMSALQPINTQQRSNYFTQVIKRKRCKIMHSPAYSNIMSSLRYVL